MKNNLMIKSLTLKNFATFSQSEVNFHDGFNCIVGETGSGKSLLLDALEMIFGGRGDKKFIRKGADFLLLEALLVTHNPQIHAELDELGCPGNGSEISLKRIIYKNGTSKTFINQSSCTLTDLAHFSRQHIDLVGQFENQKLLTDSYLLKLIDSFGKHAEILKYRSEYKNFLILKKEHSDLNKIQNDLAQRKDYLEFQVNEIKTLNPSLEDESKLLLMKEKIVNLEKFHHLESQVTHLLNGSNEESGMIQKWNQLKNLVNKNAHFFNPELAQLCLSVDQELNDFFEKITFGENLELTQEEVNDVFQKLDSYQRLKRKFGGEVNTIIEQLNLFEQELLNLNSCHDRIDFLNIEIERIHKELISLAKIIHEKRIKTSSLLSKELTHSIQEMRMIGAQISIKCSEETTLSEEGFTSLSFEAQTNPGEGFYKVKDIASGGELSRILLAYRNVLSLHDSVSVFLFDEIDTGIGGETAHSIAKSLKKVALSSQVIAITHLPQIAVYADHLVEVGKDVIQDESDVRTESVIKHFSGDGIKKLAEKMVSLS